MWRNTQNNANKMFNTKPKKMFYSFLSKHLTNYPHIESNLINKIWLNKKVGRTIHINTPLIINSNFYI